MRSSFETENRPNSYPTEIARMTVVEVQCPHCDEDVELEDGIFGLFHCPHCNNEFEFEDDSINIKISYWPKKQ